MKGSFRFHGLWNVKDHPMARAAPRVPVFLLCFLVVGFLLALVAFPSEPAAPEPGNFHTAVQLPDVSFDQSGASSVLLEVNDLTFGAGASVVFSVVIAYAICVSGSPAELVDQVTFSLGDGFTYQEPGPSEPSGYPYCTTSAPWNQSISLSYGYRNPGTYNVSASVRWYAGTIQSSNVLTVNVTSSTSTALAPFQGWLYGLTGGSAALLAVCFVLRRQMMESPSLPPGKV